MIPSPHRHVLPKEQAFLFQVLLVLLSLVGPELGWAQETSRLRFLHWTYEDIGGVAELVGGQTPYAVIGSATVLMSAASFDPLLLEEVQDGYRGPLASYMDVTNELGGQYVRPFAAGVFAISLVTNDERFQDAAFTSLQALYFAGTLSRALKNLFGRFRPNVDIGPYRFDPFSENTSFPSGHTTAAFALITPWVLYYPNAATYGLFALSAGTAVARIALDKHWPTDVLAGAAIGFFTARYLTRRHQRAPQAPRLTVQPLITPGAAGLTLRFDVPSR